LYIGRFRSLYGRVLAGAILRIAPSWAHHADAVGFDGGVPTSTAPNLRAIFNGIPIRRCSRRWGARCSSQRLEDGFSNRASLGCHGREIIWPCLWIQTWAGPAWCRWISGVIWRYSIYRCEMSWHWSLSQQLEVFILPSGKHQGFEDEWSAIRELDDECPRSHESPRRILSAFPYLACLSQHIIVRYFWEAWGKRDDARSISMQEHNELILVRALWRVITLRPVLLYYYVVFS
jgi:hypothetical protein